MKKYKIVITKSIFEPNKVYIVETYDQATAFLLAILWYEEDGNYHGEKYKNFEIDINEVRK